MVVQSTNTGSDLGSNQFDLLMPGGGVGIYDGCKTEFGTSLPGETYGGISSESQCSSFPTILQDGCEWRFDWFENADNPSVSFEQVQCPTAITDISGCIRDDDGDYPVFTATGTSSGSSSTAAAASSQTSTTAAAQETEASNTSTLQTSVAQTSTAQSSATQSSAAQSSAAAVQSSAAQSSAAAVETSAAQSSAVQTEAPATEDASTQASSSASTRTRTRKASGCAARRSSTLKVSATAVSAADVVSAASASTSTVALYGQCNGSEGSFPDGALPCVSGSSCVYSNDYYSQCQPN